MKGTLIAMALTLSAWSTPAWPEDSDLKLDLEAGIRTLRLGQETALKLRIAGTSISRLTEKSEGVVPENPGAGAFVYEFKVKPQREGKFTFGPYQLSFNGQNLTSNPVSIRVLPPWDGTYGTFFRVDSNNIALGEAVELVMETWSEKYQPVRCSLKRDDEAFASGATVGAALSTMSGTSSGGASRFYSRSQWLLTPKKPGEFRITKDLFMSFPENVNPPDIVVTVKETAPPADASGRK